MCVCVCVVRAHVDQLCTFDHPASIPFRKGGAHLESGVETYQWSTLLGASQCLL